MNAYHASPSFTLTLPKSVFGSFDCFSSEVEDACSEETSIFAGPRPFSSTLRRMASAAVAERSFAITYLTAHEELRN